MGDLLEVNQAGLPLCGGRYRPGYDNEQGSQPYSNSHYSKIIHPSVPQSEQITLVVAASSTPVIGRRLGFRISRLFDGLLKVIGLPLDLFQHLSL